MSAISNKFALAPAVAVILLVALVGCGGGSSGPVTGQPPITPEPPETSEPPQSQPFTEFLETSDDAELLLAAGIRLAGSKANFASVTQSTNRDDAGVTTDQASTTWNGSTLSVNVTRANGSSIAFEEEFLLSGGARLVERRTRDSHTFALLTVDWSNENQTDYRAGGTWIYARRSPSTGRYTSVEVGTFADGSGMSVLDPIQLPNGTAVYKGSAHGYYGIKYGHGFEDIPSGSIEYGTFSSNAELRAHFDGEGGTVNGCINCDGRATFEGEYYEFDATAGEYLDEEDVVGSVPIAMAFYNSIINTSGAFSGNMSAVGSAGTSPSVFAVSSSVSREFRISGTWGGVISRTKNSYGVPTAIVGTFGAEARHPNGTRAAFAGSVGAHLGN